MKYIMIVAFLLLTTGLKAQHYFQYDYPGKMWSGEKEIDIMREKDNKWYLDYKSFHEINDSVNRYKDLYTCSRKCYKYDSSTYYYSKAIYFVNQSEWYCAIIYGADSVKSMLYYKKGEIIPPTKCKCDPN